MLDSLTRQSMAFITEQLVHEQEPPLWGSVPAESMDRAAHNAALALLQAERRLASDPVRSHVHQGHAE